MSYEDYAELMGAGFESKEPVKPEDEFFHSVYISGINRKNHINIVEEAGKFQVRGVQYNLDEVNMVITHVKDILSKSVSVNGRDSLECFSFKEGKPPWYGTSRLPDGTPRQCPQTSAERAVNEYCNKCRAQIIVAGIFCNADGSPILSDDNKPVFIFIRGKGMKYMNVANYLSDMYKKDLSPIFEPVTDESRRFEKMVVNIKRFVTNITKGQAQSQYGLKDVFVLEPGIEIGKDDVLKILNISKNTLSKFNEKFDWSKRVNAPESQQQVPEGVLTIDEEPQEQSQEQPQQEQTENGGDTKKEEAPKQVFSFDDVNFD